MNCKHLFVVAVDLVNCNFEYRESWGRVTVPACIGTQVVEAPRMFLDNQRKAEMACPDPTPTLTLANYKSKVDGFAYTV